MIASENNAASAAAEGATPGVGLHEQWGHAFAEAVANLVVQKPREETVRFGRVTRPEELAAVGRLRLRAYRAKLPYLLDELSEDGTEAYDAHSFLFAAWRGEEMVATIRATRYPYETLRYVPEPELARWLGKGWDTDFLEWGRLLVDDTRRLNRLAPALISYAGLSLLWLTSHRKYFGYARQQSKRSFGHFQFESTPLSFQIPHRGKHSYQLLKGGLLKDVLFAMPQWVGTLTPRLQEAARQRWRKPVIPANRQVTMEPPDPAAP